MMDKGKMKSPMDRRDFLRTCSAVVAGGVALASGGLLAARASTKEGEVLSAPSVAVVRQIAC